MPHKTLNELKKEHAWMMAKTWVIDGVDTRLQGFWYDDQYDAELVQDIAFCALRPFQFDRWVDDTVMMVWASDLLLRPTDLDNPTV